MNTLTLRIDLRLLCALLALTIVGMLAFWQPWKTQGDKKTLTVTGQAIIEEAPDQYVFTPTFSAGAATSAEAVAKVSQTGNSALDALKKLGLRDDQLTTRVDSAETGEGGFGPEVESAKPSRGSEPFTAFYYIVARVKDKAQAQKITDYLAGSGATGGITPQAEFSLETRNQLDAQVRQKALQDARAKADTEAKELGIKLGQVMSVSEDPNRGGLTPLDAKADATSSSGAPPVLSGIQRISLALTVTYSIK